MTRDEKIAYLAKSDADDMMGRDLENFLIYYLTKEYEDLTDEDIDERYKEYTEE